MCLTCAEDAVRNERSKRQQTVQVSAVLASHYANVSSAMYINYFNLCFLQCGGMCVKIYIHSYLKVYSTILKAYSTFYVWYFLCFQSLGMPHFHAMRTHSLFCLSSPFRFFLFVCLSPPTPSLLLQVTDYFLRPNMKNPFHGKIVKE